MIRESHADLSFLPSCSDITLVTVKEAILVEIKSLILLPQSRYVAGLVGKSNTRNLLHGTSLDVKYDGKGNSTVFILSWHKYNNTSSYSSHGGTDRHTA